MSEANRAAPETSEEWPCGMVLLDQYEVLGRLGSGGMGTVYLLSSLAGGERYAVKRVRPELIHEQQIRRIFMRELLTWSALPEHPHLTSFRFFRTLGGEVLIFAEYVDGGSLLSRIRRGRIRTHAELLDLAIQTAWGLHMAHEVGLVHRDVKPGNILLTRDGIAKVTDFGLSRVRSGRVREPAARPAAAPIGTPGPLDPTVLDATSVSSGGLTLKYCSPEQACGQPLSRTTDVWSWGLTVLAMFTGDEFWRVGLEAPEAPERGRSGEGEAGSLALPPEVGEGLRVCFRRDPAWRWRTLRDAARALQKCYEKLTGEPYPRRLPPAPPGARQSLVVSQGRSARVPWEDPRPLLEEALRRAGRRPEEAEELVLT